MANVTAWQKKRDKPLDQCATSSEDIQNKIKQYIEPFLEKLSEKIPVGFQSAFHGQDVSGNEVTWDYAGGYNDLANKIKITSDDKIPAGSMTKLLTSSLIMKYIAEGRKAANCRDNGKLEAITLDTPVENLVDCLLTENMNMTLRELLPDSTGKWHGNEGWGSILTVDHLLSMTGCLTDYNTLWNEKITTACPDTTLDPYLLLQPTTPHGAFPVRGMSFAGGLWVGGRCKIGEEQTRSYSGLSYVLLGLVATHVQGQSDWSKMNQYELFDVDDKSIFPEVAECIEDGSKVCQGVSYGNKDKTGKDADWVHQYRLDGNAKGDHLWNMAFGLYDMLETSSLNGWTMGNSGQSMKFYSKFLHNLNQGNMNIPMDAVKTMYPPACGIEETFDYSEFNDTTVSADWFAGAFPPKQVFDKNTDSCGIDMLNGRYRTGYGKGMELFVPSFMMNSCFSKGQGNVIGHGGLDYASEGLGLFMLDGKFALATAWNSWQGDLGSNAALVNGTCQSNLPDSVLSAGHGMEDYLNTFGTEYLIPMFSLICTDADADQDNHGLKELIAHAEEHFFPSIDVDLFNGCNDPISPSEAINSTFIADNEEIFGNCEASYWDAQDEYWSPTPTLMGRVKVLPAFFNISIYNLFIIILFEFKLFSYHLKYFSFCERLPPRRKRWNWLCNRSPLSIVKARTIAKYSETFNQKTLIYVMFFIFLSFWICLKCWFINFKNLSLIV